MFECFVLYRPFFPCKFHPYREPWQRERAQYRRLELEEEYIRRISLIPTPKRT